MQDPFNAFTALADAVPTKGWRVAVKDLIAVEGLPQLGGIAARRGRIAERDAAIVRAFRAEGHAIVGVTRTDSGGFGTMTDEVVNPSHATRAVGGSSGGSAAAVAGGLAAVGLGTDTGGSIRIPAAYCNIFGFKASAGRVDAAGVLPLSPTLDQLGVLARDGDTLVRAVSVLLGTAIAEAAPTPRIAYPNDVFAVAEDTVAGPFAVLVDALGARPMPLPFDYAAMAAASSTVICAEGLTVHADDWRREPSGFPPLAAGGLRHAETVSDADLRAARETIGEAARCWQHAIADVDVLVCPTLPMLPADRYATTASVRGEAWPITNANIRFTNFANAAGLPALVAPVGGRSVQFVGRRGDDDRLVRTALRLIEGFGA